jgi:hypothetical protein
VLQPVLETAVRIANQGQNPFRRRIAVTILGDLSQLRPIGVSAHRFVKTNHPSLGFPTVTVSVIDTLRGELEDKTGKIGRAHADWGAERMTNDE